MSDFPITCKDAKTTFVLARRAERLARPLVESVAGAWGLSVNLTLGGKGYMHPWHISLAIHYVGRAARITGRPNMPLYKIVISNSRELEKVLAELPGLAAAQIEATAAAEAEGADHADD